MGVSKVVYGDDTLVDLTGDTVTPTSLTLGATAHAANGELIVGEYQYVLPVMSPDTRGGARIQPDSGLEITDTDNLRVRLALESDGTVRGGIAELTAKGHAEQVSTTGKNLLKPSPRTVTSKGVTYTMSPDGTITLTGTATGDETFSVVLDTATITLDAGTYTLSRDGGGQGFFSWGGTRSSSQITRTFESQATINVTNNSITINTVNDITYNDTFRLQLELGSTATEYEPYTGGAPSPSPDYPKEIQVVRGHEVTGKTGRFVDLIVKQGNTTLFTTPIPLPSRGWVAGLPDGTADTLRLDGAGKCEWTLPTSEVVFDGSSDEGWGLYGSGTDNWHYYTGSVVGSLPKATTNLMCDRYQPNVVGGTVPQDGIFMTNTGVIRTRYGNEDTVANYTAWLSTHNVTILYPLTTPVTEDCGYCEDWPTDIPDSATVSIPELDSVGVKYFIDSAVTELARQWYARAYAELGDAVTELAGRVAALES